MPGLSRIQHFKLSVFPLPSPITQLSSQSSSLPRHSTILFLISSKLPTKKTLKPNNSPLMHELDCLHFFVHGYSTILIFTLHSHIWEVKHMTPPWAVLVTSFLRTLLDLEIAWKLQVYLPLSINRYSL